MTVNIMAPKDRVNRCIALARQGLKDSTSLGFLSTGEQIIVALLHNRMDWLPAEFAHPLDAMDRLGHEWRVAVRVAHQMGWK